MNSGETKMKIKVVDDCCTKQLELPGKATIEQVLKGEAVNKQTIVIMLNGKVAHPSTELKEGDQLELVGVIYGG